MADNFNGYLNQVPTFPVQDGTAGTLTNLIHASEINLWIVGPSNGEILVPGLRSLSMRESHQGASMEFFAGTRRPEPKKGTRLFTMTMQRAEFDMQPLKQLIRHAYALPGTTSDVYLMDFPVRAIIRAQVLGNQYSSVLSLMQRTYDELYFYDIEAQEIQNENSFAMESITAFTPYEQLMGASGSQQFTITTQPWSQGMFSK